MHENVAIVKVSVGLPVAKNNFQSLRTSTRLKSLPSALLLSVTNLIDSILAETSL